MLSISLGLISSQLSNLTNLSFEKLRIIFIVWNTGTLLQESSLNFFSDFGRRTLQQKVHFCHLYLKTYCTFFFFRHYWDRHPINWIHIMDQVLHVYCFFFAQKICKTGVIITPLQMSSLSLREVGHLCRVPQLLSVISKTGT